MKRAEIIELFVSTFLFTAIVAGQANVISFVNTEKYVTAQNDATALKSKRPELNARLFRSDAVEKKIAWVVSQLHNPYLAWMFQNCYPNTLDTTVHYRKLNGEDDTFVYTGDNHAM